MNLALAKWIDRHVGILVCYLLASLRLLREMVRPRDSLIEPRSILLVKFWGLGNIVLLLPVVRLLRKRYPDARIVFLSLERNRELLGACEELDDRIYVLDRGPVRLLVSLVATAFRCWREGPDLTVDFEQFSRISAIIAVLGRSKQIVGLDTPGQGRSVLYHKKVRYDDRQHMSQTYLDLARAAGVVERLYRPAPVPICDEAVRAAEAFLDGTGQPWRDRLLVVFHPGSGDNFVGRRWPAPSFAALADRLVARFDAVIVLSGSYAERDVVAGVHERVTRRDRVVDASGKLSFLALGAVVARAAALVSNDTAPVHLGSAQDVPVFALFGPNTPRLYGPLSSGSHSFYRALPCSPCLTNMNYKTSYCRMPVCIRGIEVDEVFERVSASLETRPAAGRPGGHAQESAAGLEARGA